MLKNKNLLKAVILIAALTTAGVGSSMALLSAGAPLVQNQFEAAKINIQIVESNGSNIYESDLGQPDAFVLRDGITEKKVSIHNKHSKEYPTADTFVRAAIVPVLRDDEDPDVSYGRDISLVYPVDDENWFELSSYYYYKRELPRDESTTPLFERAAVVSSLEDVKNERGCVYVICPDIPEGAHVELQVLADAVQARPFEAEEGKLTPVQEAWGLTFNVEKGVLEHQ